MGNHDVSPYSENHASSAGFLFHPDAQKNYLSDINELAATLSVVHDPQRMLEIILQTIARIHNTNQGFLALCDTVGKLEVATMTGFDDTLTSDLMKLKRGQGPCGTAYREKRRIIVGDTRCHPLFKGAQFLSEKHGFRAVYTAPIMTRDNACIGTLSMHFPRPHRPTETEILLTDICLREAADFMERTCRERALRRNEERLRLATETAGIGIWEVDLARSRGIWSGAAVELMGDGKAVFDQSNWLDACYPDDREKVVAAWHKTIKKDAPYEVEFRLNKQTEDGRQRWVMTSGTIRRDVQGRAVSGIGVIFEITERKHCEQMLKDADRRKNEFLATLAHEMRNPLAPVKNALYILNADGAESAVKKQALQLMRGQMAQMERLVDDLMDVSRITQGKIELKHDIVDLADVLKSAIETSMPLVREKRLSFDYQPPEKAVSVHGDAARLVQIFSNLLNNAAKYTERGGITLAVRDDAKWVRISVQDTGIGIAPHMLSSIFELFTQADSALEHARGGLGIGLTLVRSFVDMHGGAIHVESGGIGQGSIFTVTLPKEERLPPARESETPSDGKSRIKRVLVVDDNESSANTLGWIFELLGHDCKVAHNPGRALEIASEFLPDVILLDIGMPEMNGYELCRLMKRQPAFKDTVFVAQTGWGQKEHLEQSRAAGFHRHLVKPIDVNMLRKLMNEM